MEQIRNDEPPIDILFNVSIKFCAESQESLLVHPLEEVLLGSLGIKSVDILNRIFFRTEAIVGWDQLGLVLFGLGVLNRGQWEVSIEGSFVVLLSELIAPVDMEGPSIYIQLATIIKVLTLHKIFRIRLPWLIQSEPSGQLLPVQIHREDVLSTIIGIMNFCDIYRIIS